MTGGTLGSGGGGSGGGGSGGGASGSGGGGSGGGSMGSGGATGSGGTIGGSVGGTGGGVAGATVGGGAGGGGGRPVAGGRGGSLGSASGGSSGAGGAAPQSGLFRRGINLGNRLDAPTEGAWGATLNAADFPRIAARGFDHVRLPIRFNAHAATSAPYTVETTFFARVDWAIQQALTAGLAIIVDFHHYDEIHLDPAAHQDRFLGIWTQIAARYRGQPAQVAFELLNEPSGMLNATWNSLAARALAVVRQTNPSRLVIIDSSNFGAASALAALDVGGNGATSDRNIMASVHMYEPSLFAFQGQTWMGPIWATTNVVFPGPPVTPLVPVQAALDTPWAKQWFADYNSLPADQNPSGIKTILTQIEQARAYTQRTGRPVYNGEWGPQDGADSPSRQRYIRMMREECEKAGITWAIWEDPTNMKLFDPVTGAWDTALLSALFP